MIKLTNVFSQPARPLFVNIDHIGHLSRAVNEKTNKEYTIVGVTTHNNGGFHVKETPEEIIELILDCRQL